MTSDVSARPEESPGFPLKGSFKGDIDIDTDVDVDVDMDIWVAAKEFSLSCHSMDIWQLTWFLDYGN